MKYFALLPVLVLCVIPAVAQEAVPQPVIQVQASDRITAAAEPLLRQYERSDRQFVKLQASFQGLRDTEQDVSEQIVSYFHRRTAGDMIVEGDFIRYQFDPDTGELLEHVEHWRDLGTIPDPLITAEQAQAIVGATARTSQLYIISPDSKMFSFYPPPDNPCWVLRVQDDVMGVQIHVVDAVTAEYVGLGPPPPSEGLSIHGPDWGACPQDPIWYNHAESARVAFEAMGYSTNRVGNASQATIGTHLQSDDGAMFYELDHGGSWSFHNRCDDDLTAAEVETYLASYASMPFTFLGSCEGMCDQTDNHFSYEFRKGLSVDTVTVGYCHMDATYCDNCWGDSIAWQNELFDWMDSGYTVGYSFYRANLAYPDCAGSNNCMRIAGDSNLVFAGSTYPNVRRSLCGALYNAPPYYISPLLPVSSLTYTRAHHIRCDSYTPAGYWLTLGTSSSYPYLEIVFLNDTSLTGFGPITINGENGAVRLMSASNRSQGIIINGELNIVNGGEIRVYE